MEASPDPLVAAYIAGYFDGEGSVSAARGNGEAPIARIVIVQRDREPLAWIREQLGYGNLHYRGTSWAIQIGNRDDVMAFVRTIYPYARQKKAHLRIAYRIAARTIVLAFPERRRLSPAVREMRFALGIELEQLNLGNKANRIANRHGRLKAAREAA